MNQNSREDFNFVQPLLYSSEMNFWQIWIKNKLYRIKIYLTMEFIYTYFFTEEFKPYIYFQKMKIYKLY